MLQFRPDGPTYAEEEIGWVFREGRPYVCAAKDVRPGDLLPNCELRDEADPTIRILVPVTRIARVGSDF